MAQLRYRPLSRRRLLSQALRMVPLCAVGSSIPLFRPDGTAGADKGRETAGTLGDGEMLELGAQTAVEHIRRGDMKAEDYAARLLKQYRAHRDLNAFVFIDEQRVLEGARAVDRARARDQKLGPASGLPFAVKDQIAVAGYPATGGNGALRGYIPKRSATVVDAVVKAGGIVFGKTNLPDMVAGGNILATDATYNRFFGGTHNPYDMRRIPGGSSGGNAAAIAARIVPAAIGEDTGGSVRWPAALCGISGLRPSTYTVENLLRGTARKRYSDSGIIIPPADLLETFGPMARTVADVAFLDELITGDHAPAVDLHQVRIAIPRADYWDNDYVDHGVEKVLNAAFAKLRAAGANLVEIDLNSLIALTADERAFSRRSQRNIARWLQENLPAVKPEQLYEGGVVPRRSRSVIAPSERGKILTAAASGYARVFRDNNVVAVAFPASPIPAPPIDPATGWDVKTMIVNGKSLDEDEVFNKSHLSWGADLGAPGLTIPAGLVRGLPVALELEGVPGSDSHLLGLGIAVERVLGRVPPPPFLRT